MAVLRPRAGLTPFPDCKAQTQDFSPSPPESEAKNVVSPDSGYSEDGVGFVFDDDLADVDLGVDWGGQVPGFMPAVQVVLGEVGDFELADDFLDFDGNLDLDEYRLS